MKTSQRMMRPNGPPQNALVVSELTRCTRSSTQPCRLVPNASSQWSFNTWRAVRFEAGGLVSGNTGAHHATERIYAPTGRGGQPQSHASIGRVQRGRHWP